MRHMHVCIREGFVYADAKRNKLNSYALTTEPVQRAVCCVEKEFPTIFKGFPHSKLFSPRLHFWMHFFSIIIVTFHPDLHFVREQGGTTA